MQSNQLIKFVYKLKNLVTFIDNTYNINEGGCCYLSYIIAKQLEKHNILYLVGITSYGDFDISEIKSNINRRSRNGVFSFDDYGCNHISIKIGHLDVNVIEDGTSDVEYINLTSKDLHWLYNKGLKNSDWNTTYNTDNNQIISKFINVLFQTV